MYRPIKKCPNAWDGYITPFKITDNVYYVGAYQVCTHLIDTGDGLVIIDAGYLNCLYMVIDSIHRMGFDPKDIKYIFSTHAHYDHVEANAPLRGITGAKVVIGKEDADILAEQFAPADIIVDDGDTISLGNKTFKFIHTPGHTIGTMSIFFDDTIDGKKVSVGTFGGAGANTLTKKCATYYEGCTDDYLKSCERLLTMTPDVFIANHTWNNDTEGKGKRLLDTGVNDFVGENNDWVKFVNYCIERCNKTIAKDKEAGLL